MHKVNVKPVPWISSRNSQITFEVHKTLVLGTSQWVSAKNWNGAVTDWEGLRYNPDAEDESLINMGMNADMEWIIAGKKKDSAGGLTNLVWKTDVFRSVFLTVVAICKSALTGPRAISGYSGSMDAYRVKEDIIFFP